MADDFEKAILFSFDQTGAVNPQLKVRPQVRSSCVLARHVRDGNERDARVAIENQRL